MSITVTVEQNSDRVGIRVVGSFDFSLFNDFRSAYSDYLTCFKELVVDMQAGEYLDSAALGMLLSMRNSVSSDTDIIIANSNSFIRNILMISRFDKRFTIT